MSTVVSSSAPWLGTIFLVGILVACSPGPQESDVKSAPGPASVGGTRLGGARLAGTIRLEGPPPPPSMIRFDADPQCATIVQGHGSTDDAVRVGDEGGVQSAFVYLKDGVDATRFAAPPAPVVLDQQGCRYVPRVLGIQVGQTLIIRNSDPLLHTVRADARENARFNVATPVQGMEVKRTWQTPEVMVPIGCDMHPWMHAFIGILPHPYFTVTDSAGRFALDGVPPGTYTVAVWHERFGTLTQNVVVGDRTPPELTFIYDASAPPAGQH